MHERSWARGLLATIRSVAGRERATRVVGVTVRLGPASSLSPEHLSEHFTEVARGTIADGARLEITGLSQDEACSGREMDVLESIEFER